MILIHFNDCEWCLRGTSQEEEIIWAEIRGCSCILQLDDVQLVNDEDVEIFLRIELSLWKIFLFGQRDCSTR